MDNWLGNHTGRRNSQTHNVSKASRFLSKPFYIRRVQKQLFFSHTNEIQATFYFVWIDLSCLFGGGGGGRAGGYSIQTVVSWMFPRILASSTKRVLWLSFLTHSIVSSA